MSVRDELREVLEIYLEISLREMILRKRVEKIRERMIERLRNMNDPEAEKLLKRLEKARDVKDLVNILEKYESLVRKQ